ncbi:hypothetical protein DRO61_11955 [Candidatus Bathyarchaeota archaeon]|nr:MAG: hypothetical protein DRO61_11955 [Candidatus Bathyarchaeota archaeon]
MIKMSIEKKDNKVFLVNKDRTCPLCGLKMMRLSPHLWHCKCGHKEKREADVEEKSEEEHESRRKRGGEKDGHFRETKQPSIID